jgi:opacity protein-like surface antigen
MIFLLYYIRVKIFWGEKNMKKSILSLVSVMALSGLAYAGGDMTTVVEPVIEIPEVKTNPFYVGLGLGEGEVNNDDTSEEFSATTLILQAGYQYNEYVALEGRYTFGLDTDYSPGNTNSTSSDYDGDFSSWGLYIKPMYPIGDFSLYMLLGYGGVMLDDLVGGDAYESGFQWGLGAGYAMSENYTVFVDYVSLYDDTGFDYRARLDDVDSDTWTFGVSYRF